MPKAYLELANERVNYHLNHLKKNYHQPEYFGYDFKDWVSPYTKGAHQPGGVAVILQDWSSSEGLSGDVCPEIQEYGRTLELKTNKRLECLLQSFFGVGISGTYATNVFPFVKEGNMSSFIPTKDIIEVSMIFLKRELEIASPKYVIGLGRKAQHALQSLKIAHIAIPHPAARIGTIEKHRVAWEMALAGFRRDA
ncbi:uracil-DNA glycosylase family protein [Chlorobaculum sp. 24CR]|uniref:uracil-DNA glycosylase family protein n=1 Tax=Chlorobaculum sp. 24CR TaxID=2508878 RepID=UPI00142FAD89|nr:uracil-DNA glycosylase family protein [Chlorobaculum sp. 24CR]